MKLYTNIDSDRIVAGAMYNSAVQAMYRLRWYCWAFFL